MFKNNQSGIAFIPVLIIVAALIAGAGAAYYFTDGFGANKTNKADKTSQTNSDETSELGDQPNKTKPSEATGAETMSLVKTALQGGDSVKCVSKAKVDGKYAISTMYIKDKDNIRLKIRSDMGTLNTLYKNQAYSYTWSEGQTRGTKFATSEQNKNVEQTWQENLDDAKESELQDISCQQTAVKDSLFKIPANVEFSDASQFTN